MKCNKKFMFNMKILLIKVTYGPGVGIERHVPAIPLSQDEQRNEDLQRSLAVYRMVFGRPRQEDLLAYLVNRVGPERLEALRGLLQIDLRPGDVSECRWLCSGLKYRRFG